MERDISKIAKIEYLLPQLQASLDMRAKQIEKFAADLMVNPVSTLEWADKHFRAAAEIKILGYLIQSIGHNVATERDGSQPLTEYSRDEINKIIWRDHKYSRAVPRSTSTCSNLMEQNVLEVSVDNVFRNGHMIDACFRDAQFKDHEFKEHFNAIAEANRIAREAKEAAGEEAKRAAKAEARKVRRNKGNV